ncbi:MAG: hypothetical protein IJ257_08090, partial [Treponema sp.]|nr:hypothetical protein [Treponema sp.]
MKKSALFALSSLFIFTLFSCKEKKSYTIEYSEPAPQAAIDETTGERVFTVGNFFTPDYTPYEPEPESVAGRVNLSSPKSGGKAESIVPGLRKLSDYKTSYNTKKSDFKIPEVTKLAEDSIKNEKSSKKDQPFTVSDWGPKEPIPAEVRYPSFYVLFSEPVVSLAALNQES